MAEASKKQITQKPGKRIFHSILGRVGDYQADIIFMKYTDSREYKKANEGYTCALLMVEVPTRFAYCTPLRNKTAEEVTNAFEQIIGRGVNVINLTTDDGTEFNNKVWDGAIRRHKINQYVKEPGDRLSLGIIDRLCRTLKEWIEQWQIEKESLSWVTALPSVLERYNNHKIRTLKASPLQLRLRGAALSNAQLKTMAKGRPALDKANQIKPGDKVRVRLTAADQPRDNSRLAKPSQKLAKGGDRWSNKVYTVASIEKYSFHLRDSGGQPAKRTYRHHELKVVPRNSVDVPDVFSKVAHEARNEKRKKKEGL